MSKRRDPNPTFDLFIPLMNDLPLKDQREVMERPFFSLQKRKRGSVANSDTVSKIGLMYCQGQLR